MVSCAQLLDDASRGFVTGHGAGGDLTPELAGLFVGDLVAGRTEGCVSAGDRPLDFGGGACRRGLALLRGAGPDYGLGGPPEVSDKWQYHWRES